MNSLSRSIFLLEVLAVMTAVGMPSRHRTASKKQIVLFPDDDVAVDDLANGMTNSNIAAGDSYDDQFDSPFDGNVIDSFPDGESHNNLLRSETLIRCMRSGQTFCENEAPVEYSYEAIERGLKNSIKTNRVLIDEAEGEANQGEEKTATRNNFGSFERVEQLCETKETTIYPQMGRDIHGEVWTIVNQRDYRQRVKVQLCVSARGKRKGKGEYLMTDAGKSGQWPNGIRPRCRQVYQEFELLSGSSNEIIEKKIFNVPSYCRYEVVSVRS